MSFVATASLVSLTMNEKETPPAATREVIVHWKGFGSGIPDLQTKGSSNSVQMHRAIALVLQITGGRGVVVFDGDDMDAKNFTVGIVHMWQHNPGLRFVAYKDETKVAKFWAKWGEFTKDDPTRMELRLVTVDTFPATGKSDYASLGVKALEATGSQHVVCLGGGDIVKDEFCRAFKSRNEAAWFLFPVTRPMNEGGPLDRGSLYSIVNNRIQQM